MVCGLAEESGEVSGLLKREVYKKKDIPEERWVEELGDTLWYLLGVCIAKGINVEDVFDYNLKKLEGRYGAFE